MQLLLMSTFMCSAGCVAQTRVGIPLQGTPEAAWVYVDSDDWDYGGVYRCEATPNGPVCLKAKLFK